MTRPNARPGRRSESSHHGPAKNVIWMLIVGSFIAGIAVFSATVIRQDRSRQQWNAPRTWTSPTPPPPPESLSRMSSGRLQEYATDSGVAGGALAAQRAMAQQLPEQLPLPNQKAVVVPVSIQVGEPATIPQNTVTTTVLVRSAEQPPTPTPAPAIKITRIRSGNPASREKALLDAVELARLRIVEQLHQLEPPVYTYPTVETVRTEYLRPDSIREVQPTAEDKANWAAAKLDPNRVWVEIDVELSAEQVRHLRSEERVRSGGIYAIALFLGVLGLFTFLRLDSWTKGYLTLALGIGTAVVVGGGIALLVLG